MLVLIIPFYNPSKKWEEEFLKRSLEFSNQLKENYLWLLVNDGSTIDTSKEELILKEKLNEKIDFLHLEKNKGKGAAIREAVKSVKAPYYIYTDIDLPYTSNSMMSVYDELKSKQTEIVLGQRNNLYYENISIYRKYLSILTKKIFKIIFRIPIEDTQCGLKGFREKGKNLFLQTTINRFLFDMEFIKIISKQNEIKFKAVNVQTHENIKLSSMGWEIIIHECFNLLKIWLK